MLEFGRLSLSSPSILSLVLPRAFVIELSRRWSSARVQWGALLALLGVMTVALTVGAQAVYTAHQSRSIAEQKWLAFQATAIKEDPAVVPGGMFGEQPSADMGARDFTTGLPEVASLPDLVQMIQREAVALNVQLQGLQAKAGQAPGASLLGRSELVLNLRGNYPAVRQVLSSTLARYPYVNLPTLRLRRAEGSMDVEATATLAVWTRPLGISPSLAFAAPSETASTPSAH